MSRTADACSRQRSALKSCKNAAILMVSFESDPSLLFFSYVMMLQCWRSEPWERPSFRRCLSTLQSISGELRRGELPEIEGSSGSSGASCVSGKAETRVRFDEEHKAEHNQTKDASNTSNKNSTSSSQSDSSPASDNRQLYANEGVSRL